MAKRSRPLGISKSRKQKKIHREDSPASSNEPTPQLTLEVGNDEDPDNDTVQLKSLWNSYLQSSRESDALLNGIVNECDALLSNDKEGRFSKDKDFLAVFALALSELTIFNEDKINDYFDDALDILNLSDNTDDDDKLLNLVRSKILFQRIPLQYISQLETDSNERKLNLKLDSLFGDARDSFSVLNTTDANQHLLIFEILSSINDLLDIVENFGTKKNLDEGLDSDEEDIDDIEIKLSSNHPLFGIKSDLGGHYKWLQDKLMELFEILKVGSEEKDDKGLYYSVGKIIGELFLKEAEEPSRTFLTLQYGDEDEDDGEEDKEIQLSEQDQQISLQAQTEAKKLITRALEYLEYAQDPENPDTWAQLAGAYIDLGNLEENQSDRQDEIYKKAETILKKANTASHNKYQYILDNLSEQQDV